MRRVKNNEMPEIIKNQLDAVLSEIPAKATISAVWLSIDPSIAKLYNLGQIGFSPRLTPENFYTYGATYKKITKAVNTIIDCEYLSEPTVTFRRRYRYGHKTPSYLQQYIGTDRERLFFEYSVTISFAGMTPERAEEIRLYNEKKEQERIAMEEYAARRRNHIEYWSELHKNETYEYAGCANGWGDDTPEIVKIADADKDCFYESCSIGRCLTKYVCHKYKFYYTVDSSD
jgi:hypothetical protein